MADLKISQLTDGGASQATDEYVIARSGANYRIDGASVAAAATSVGTLTSLTVSGDLTVDTSTLVVASGNNSVGVGTASPGTSVRLNVAGSVNLSGTSFTGQGSPTIFLANTTATTGRTMAINSLDSGGLQFYDVTGGGATRLTLDGSGNLAVDTNVLYVDATNNRVGVGTATPGNVLSVSGVAGISGVSGGGATVPSTAHVSSSTLRLGLRGSVMTSDDAGLTTVGTYLCNNVFFKNASGNPAYLTTNPASAILLTDNVTIFRRAASGTADTDITFTESARIDASGNLGLGVTPSAWNSGYKAIQNLTSSLFGTTSRDMNLGANVFVNSGGNYAYIQSSFATNYTQYNGAHSWYNAPSGTAGNAISFTQAMTLDASGNLLVGATSIRSTGYSTNNSQYAMETTGFGGAQWFVNRADGEGTYLVLGKSRGTTVNSNTVVASGDNLGAIIFQGTDGSAARSAAAITAAVDGTPGASDMPGRLVFSTTADGSTSLTERARITSAGNLLVGETTYGSRRFSVSGTSGEDVVISSDSSRAQGTGWYLFYGTSDTNTTLQAWIRGDGTYGSRPNVYGGTSDAKLKQDIIDSSSQWDDIKSVRVRKFRFKDDPSQLVQIGVVAQELEQTSPGLVEDTPDYEEIEVTDEDGNVTTERKATGTVTKSVKYSILYMKSIKALQEAMARIEALEARLEALEA